MTPLKLPRYGLVAAGSVGRGILSHVPFLRRELGPVASSTPNAAGRISSTLKCGLPAREMAVFNACSVVLACSPGHGIERVAARLDDPAISWRGKVLLFCDSGASSLDFPRFQELGAFVGSFNTISSLEKSFVIEGHPRALREAKRLVKAARSLCFEVQVKGIPLFDAARTFSTSLFTPLIDSCVECIFQSGIERKAAARVAESLLQFSLRSYLHAGRRGWAGPVASNSPEAVDIQYRALCELNPLRAEYFFNAANYAFQLYRTFPELQRYRPKHEP